MKIKLSLILTLFILFSLSVKASQEADWIISNLGEQSTTEEIAYATLALKAESSNYSSEISALVNQLKTYLKTCISDNSCDTKNTALSILALKDRIPTTELNIYATWLLNSASTQYTGDLSGWLVQIVSSASGTCTLRNTQTNESQTISVQADYTPWERISSEVLTENTKSLKLDCSDLESSGLILSLFQEKTENGIKHYYIKKEEHNTNIIELSLGNSCWGSTYKSSCTKDITALVLYALQKAGKTADSTWLKGQTPFTPLQNAYLYKLTTTKDYLDDLKNTQSSLGDWNQDLDTTAMIIYLTKTFLPSDSSEKAYSWISQSKNPSRYCWPLISCNLITTSIILMAKTPTTITADKDTDGDGYTDEEERNAGTDHSDPDDYPSDGGNGTTAQRRKACPEGNNCRTEYYCPGECNYLGQCIDIKGDNCPEPGAGEECIYGDPCTTDVGCDGICNLYESCDDIQGDGCPSTDTRGTTPDTTTKDKNGVTPDTTPTDGEETEEQGRSVLFWFLLFLLLLIALVGGSYLAYKKGLIKFKFMKESPKKTFPAYKPKLKPVAKKTPYRPATRPRTRKSPVRKHMENALEKSMKEMEDLLKGK